MANNDTLFILDEEADEAGGFNDAPELPVEDDVNPGVELDEPEKEEEPESDEIEPDESETDEPKDEPDEPEPEPEEKEEQRFNELAAILTKKDEQINTLVEQVKALTDTVVKPKPEIEQPPAEPQLTQQDWEDDPAYCNKVYYEYRKSVDDYNEKMQQTEQERTQKSEQENLKAIHAKDYAEEAEELSVLKDNQEIRQVWLNIFTSNGFDKQPDGVLRATRELKRQAKARGIDLYTYGQKPTKNDEPPKNDEPARQERVKKGSMQPGGNNPGNKVSLTASQAEVARKFGVSPDAYLKTLAALGGK